VRRNIILKTGTSCRSKAMVPNHVYRSFRCLMKAFLSFFVNPSNLKYLQCWNGPARYPVRIRKMGVPATGIRFNGRNIMNSRIWRKENGEYTVDSVGFPSCFTGSPASGSMVRELATRSWYPSLTRTASNTSTRHSSTKNASNNNATIAAPSPRTKKAPLIQARGPWNIARKAT